MSSTLVKSDKPNLPQQLVVVDHDAMLSTELPTLPPTPVAAISPNLNSPLSELAPSTPSTTAMASPLVVTKAEILDLHSILSAHDLPKVPHLGDGELSTSAVVLNSSAGTTASIATNSSPVGNRKVHNNPQGSPQKTRHKNYNNNQDDINSIESITSFTQHQVCTDFNWIDEMVEERNCDELMHKNKRKKSKKSLHAKSSSDQLDGLKLKDKHQLNESAKLKKHDSKSMTSPYDDNDEKVVKCLYYSLMCCDCTIS
ncbi:uncharacterized protein LOC108605567 isoform X2 [Drosophila busckii]|nr:uncharacterized protein LOC108605567 isoform X2 [Drosophila busckii]